MNKLRFLSLSLLLVLVSCSEQGLIAVGLLESERIELVAEYSETIVSIAVKEGQQVANGELLLSQDPERMDIAIGEAQASIDRLQALLDEQRNGPRQETIAAARARLNQGEIDLKYAEREFKRLSGLRERDLTSVESVDSAERRTELAIAQINLAQAQLDELLAGTRVEQLEQSRYQLQQLNSQLAGLQLNRKRHDIVAPRDGVIDSLPFEAGERPRTGDVVVVILSGEQPYARIYVPEQARLRVQPGSQLQVTIDGLEQPVTGTVRRIASEASFTPYFALTERDRGRLSYVAEVDLPDFDTRLPDGVPVQVIFEQVESAND